MGLVTETIRAAGLGGALSAGLVRWRRPAAEHDPAKVVLDLSVALALGEDFLADVAALRCGPGIYGSVVSNPSVPSTITAVAADSPAAIYTAARSARGCGSQSSPGCRI